MKVPDRRRRGWPARENDAPSRVNTDAKPWVVSLVAHTLILITLGLLPRVEPMLDSRVTILARENRDAPTEPLDTVVEVPDQDFDELLPEIGTPSVGLVDQAAPAPLGDVLNLVEAIEAEEASPVAADRRTLVDKFADDGAALTDEVTGVHGATVNARGVVGSVERITREILKQLEKNKVLVVWLMDASESLRGRREEIIQHFDRVYEELDQLVDGKGEPLLTIVGAFGESLVPMMPKPTADREEIQRSVRRIAADATGVENVFSAIQAAAVASKKFTGGGRRVMIVVVTDEKGNDLPVLEDALALVKRRRMSVYVMGPTAPFGYQQIRVKWTDRDSGKTSLLPVDRGPETAQVEHAHLAIWRRGPGSRILSSGFGTFGLTRIAQESGGLYLLQDDGAIGGPTFDVDAMSRYQPDYVSLVDYTKMARGHPLRMAILRTAQASNQLLQKQLPMTFLAAGIQFEIRRVQRQLARIAEVLARSLSELGAARKFRDKETSPRWRAHYDLLMGRLLANQVRCASYARGLDAMYANPRVPEDGVNNAWRMVRAESTADAKLEPSAKNQEKDARLAREYLRRVLDEHPDTPWSVIADRELKFPFAFRWRAVFMDPPAGVPLPWDKVPWEQLTEAQKVAKADFDARKQRARQRRQKPAANAGQPKRRPPPKL